MKRTYKIVLLLSTVIISMGFSFYTQASFKDKLYCSIKNNTMVVSLKKDNNYLCKNYISYAQNAIYKQYGEIQKINTIIAESDNKEFWNQVIQQKGETIDKLSLLIKNIRYNTDKFEKNLIKTVQKYLTNTLEKERKYLEKIQMNISLIRADTPRIREIKSYLQQGQEKLNIIQHTNSMDTMLESLKEYIYLKRTLTGTSE